MSLVIDRLLKIFDVSNQEATSLTAATLVGATSLTVKNIQGFADDDYVVIGTPGADDAEIAQISATPSGVTIAVGALTLAHASGSLVTVIPYNKIKVYRSDTETGTYAEITGSPFTMQADQNYTPVIDPTGTLAKWYKYSYYNSQTTAESALSSAYLGGLPNMLCTLEEVKSELDINDHNVDAQLIRHIENATDRIIKYTGVQFIAKTISAEKHDVESAQDTVHVDYYPIYGTPTAVLDNGETLTYNADPDLTDYFIYPGYIVGANGCFYPGNKRFSISYTAYQEPTEEIHQAALQMACILSGKKVRTSQDGEGITQAVAITSIPKDIWAILDRYKRRFI